VKLISITILQLAYEVPVGRFLYPFLMKEVRGVVSQCISDRVLFLNFIYEMI
jgi:hypothetical protein